LGSVLLNEMPNDDEIFVPSFVTQKSLDNIMKEDF
jgi:hypothetical protein